jgi:hypothetical protein
MIASADAAVTVGEGVDRLELGVGDCGLDQGWQIVAVGKGQQVGHVIGHRGRRWRDVERSTW